MQGGGCGGGCSGVQVFRCSGAQGVSAKYIGTDSERIVSYAGTEIVKRQCVAFIKILYYTYLTGDM